MPSDETMARISNPLDWRPAAQRALSQKFSAARDTAPLLSHSACGPIAAGTHELFSPADEHPMTGTATPRMTSRMSQCFVILATRRLWSNRARRRLRCLASA